MAGGRPRPHLTPLRELCDRETLRAAIAARRAGTPRVHKTLSNDSREFLLGVIRQHFATGNPAAAPPASLIDSLLAAKAAGTWERYAHAIRPWFAHAEASGFPALPAGPLPFACWLAATGERDRGYSQTKMRCVAISQLSALLGLPSPEAHHLVTAYRSVARRTKRARRGRSRPVLAGDLASALRSPPPAVPPRTGRGWRGPLSPSTANRARAATAGHMAVLFEAGLRYDDSREGQLGDVLFFPDGVDVSVFGSKTDPLLAGQTAQLPPPHDPAADSVSGARALTETTRRGLERLTALDAATFRAVADRLARSFPADQATPAAMATWPDAVRDLALPLYARGLLVHCLPYYGRWLWEPITPETDLSATLPTAEFARRVRSTLAASGVPTERVAAHSMRIGSAATLIHGGLPLPTLSRVLRHRDERSSAAYVPQSLLVADTTAAMRTAHGRSRAVSQRVGLPSPIAEPGPRGADHAGRILPRGGLRHH